MTPLPVTPMPDVEQVVINYLLPPRLPEGTSVGSEWPPNWLGRLAGGVVAVSQGGGGTRLRSVTADRTVDIDILAATKSQARVLAAAVSAHLIATSGTVQPGARIYGVEETSLIWLPYKPSAETDQIPRYVLVMSLVVRPA